MTSSAAASPPTPAAATTSESQFYDFPPFFTLQPVETTQEKQLKLWRRLILEWFAGKGEEAVLALDSFELFHNAAIDRKLDDAGRQAVAQDLVASGHGQWQTQDKTLYVFVKTPSEWASLIHEFVQTNGLQGTIYTLYELHSGDLTRNSPIQGIEPNLCLQALQLLSTSGKAQMFASEESMDETGVKFL